VELPTGFAQERGHTILELAVSWLASQNCVGSIIAGVTNADQVVANAAAADWDLSAAEVAAVDAIVARDLLHPQNALTESPSPTG
jgi:aryl-alcohol dehydrogenase-like predicted oxidoreductase